jgi:hypothetical protein
VIGQVTVSKNGELPALVFKSVNDTILKTINFTYPNEPRVGNIDASIAFGALSRDGDCDVLVGGQISLMKFRLKNTLVKDISQLLIRVCIVTSNGNSNANFRRAGQGILFY